MLELEVVRAEEEASVEREGGSMSLYKGREYRTSPPGPQNLPSPKELYLGDGWVTHVRVDKNPLKKGGHNLCLDKTCR